MPSAPSYRVYTPEERLAWGAYPLHERLRRATLQAAVRYHRACNDPLAADTHFAARVKAATAERKRRFDQLPDMCYKHEHPMRCGRQNKFYDKSDRVSPICDAYDMMIEVMYGTDAFGLFGGRSKKRVCHKPDGYDEQEAAEERARETQLAHRRGKMTADPRWRCENPKCNNTDVGSLIESKDGHCCPCGTMVRGAHIDSGEEWRCHADDGTDKNEAKKRADRQAAPQLPSDIEHGPVAPEQRKAERAKLRAAAGKNTHVPTHKGNGRGLADAQKIIEEDREREQRAKSELTDREELKRTRILEQLQKMFKKLKPIDHAVCKEVRRSAAALWLDAVRHARACERASCCELRLVDRSPFIIASSVFSLTVDALINGELTISEPLDREHLVDLQMRMQRSTEFSNASSLTQMATAKSMLNLMQVPGFNACVPCELPVVPAVPAKPTPLAVPLRRMDSTLSNSGEHSPSGSDDQLPMRNAVAQVFLAHKSELPVSVKDGAVRALGSPGFVSGCQQVECLKLASLQAVAFCVLNAVAREQADTSGPSFASGVALGALNVQVAHKLELDLAVAEEAIAAIRPLVPTDAASEASVPQEDDLFV